MGSSKMPLKKDDLPLLITDTIEVIERDQPEEAFLQLASLAYQYRQAGSVPINLEQLFQVPAEEEILPYASSKATNAFRTIIAEELYPLLSLWLTQCASKNQLAEPEIIPELLDIAVRRKEFRKLIQIVCGKRGEWLCKLNPEWDFYTQSTSADVIWTDGTPDERKGVLRDLRLTDPKRSIELLQSTWDKEGANEKAAFLEIMRINLSESDLPWLESLKEKAQKVNTLRQELLKLIPTSAIVQQYWNIVKEAVSIKTGKALLGMLNKTVIEVNEKQTFPEGIFKTGIDKLSSNKNISDEQFILIQLISSVSPANWNKHLSETPEHIIELFQKEKKSALYLPALCMAAARFDDKDWIKALLDHADSDLIDSSIVQLIAALPEMDRDEYAVKYIKRKPNELIPTLLEQEKEWSVELAREVLKFTANEVYAYNRTFYKPAAMLIPVQLIAELESFTPSEEGKKVYWKNQSDELARLLDIKKQILQSF